MPDARPVGPEAAAVRGCRGASRADDPGRHLRRDRSGCRPSASSCGISASAGPRCARRSCTCARWGSSRSAPASGPASRARRRSSSSTRWPARPATCSPRPAASRTSRTRASSSRPGWPAMPPQHATDEDLAELRGRARGEPPVDRRPRAVRADRRRLPLRARRDPAQPDLHRHPRRARRVAARAAPHDAGAGRGRQGLRGAPGDLRGGRRARSRPRRARDARSSRLRRAPLHRDRRRRRDDRVRRHRRLPAEGGRAARLPAADRRERLGFGRDDEPRLPPLRRGRAAGRGGPGAALRDLRRRGGVRRALPVGALRRSSTAPARRWSNAKTVMRCDLVCEGWRPDSQVRDRREPGRKGRT